MKIERLYGITVYILNHGITSASELARYFEVSVRTIQRDIDSLCLSGIPVIAVSGARGGYEISEKVIKKRFNGKYPVRKSIQTEFAHTGGETGNPL